MSELKPSVMQMLDIGKACELHTVEESYDNYMGHYDCFFLIEKYGEQYNRFLGELKALGLVVDNRIVDMPIDEAIKKVKEARK